MSVPFTGRETDKRNYPLNNVVVNGISIPIRRCVAANGFPVVTPKQLQAIRTIAGYKAINIERESRERFKCDIDGITKRVASLLINELKGRAWMAVTETEGVM